MTKSQMTQLYDVYGVFKHFVFALIRAILIIVREMVWFFDGTRRLFAPYETSAHVERIVWRSKKSIFECVHPQHFIGYHDRFDHPNVVLDDDVILTCVTRKEAVFFRLKRSLWHYTTDKVPFCWINMHDDATEIITMPVSSLHRLADQLGEIKTPSLIISNQGRCGSTLLCKLVHLSHKNVLALSEPDALVSLQDLIQYQNKMGPEFDRLMKSSLRLIFKPVTDADAIVIKIRLTAMRVVKYVGMICPEVKQVYMQRRNLLKTVQSWRNAFVSDEGGKALQLLAKYHMLNLVVPHFFGLSDQSAYIFSQGSKMLDLQNPFETLVCAWADNVNTYLNCSKVVTFHVIFYEDLLRNAENELRRLFELINVEPDNLREALEIGFKGDAQKDTPLAQDITHTRKPIEYTPEIKKRVDRYLDALGLPRLD